MKTRVCIVGGGPAGLTASLYLLRAGIDHVIIEKNEYGGNILEAISIKNYPGIVDISGREYIMCLRSQIDLYDGKFIRGSVTNIEREGDKFKISTKRREIVSDYLIIATGTKRLSSGVEIHNFDNTSFCALCDGSNFKGKSVSVIGAGNNGVDSAIYLSNIAKDVTVFSDVDAPSCDHTTYEMAKNIENIKFEFNAKVTDIYRDKLVYQKDGKEVEFETEGTFIYIGFTPETEIFDEVKKDEYGYIYVDKNLKTSVDKVYACGDCIEGSFGQLVTAQATGAQAAISVGKELRKCAF